VLVPVSIPIDEILLGLVKKVFILIECDVAIAMRHVRAFSEMAQRVFLKSSSKIESQYSHHPVGLGIRGVELFIICASPMANISPGD
jgi:hypothetical protein